MLESIRENFWDYPEQLFFAPNSLFRELQALYLGARPISHFISISLVILFISGLLLTDLQAVLSFNRTTFIEGVVVGTQANGDPQRPE
ncbi:MAG: hypothetical protein ACOCXP_02955, partial [Candidatus Dojkabacteria bacterium]